MDLGLFLDDKEKDMNYLNYLIKNIRLMRFWSILAWIGVGLNIFVVLGSIFLGIESIRHILSLPVWLAVAIWTSIILHRHKKKNAVEDKKE